MIPLTFRRSAAILPRGASSALYRPVPCPRIIASQTTAPRWRRSLAYASYAVWPLAMPARPVTGVSSLDLGGCRCASPPLFRGRISMGACMWGLAAWVNGGISRRNCRRGTVAAGSVVSDQTTRRAHPGAARRALERFEHLRPENDTPDACEAWLAKLGEQLPEEDALAVYLDICELAGWDATGRLTATAAAPVVPDPATPPQSTAVAIVTSGSAAPAEPAQSEIVDGLIEVSPTIAARGFVDWCRVHGKAGTYNSEQLAAVESAYFADERLVPVAERPFRAALALVPGVSRVRPKTRKHGRRPVSWQITPAATVSTDLPWTDLERRAA